MVSTYITWPGSQIERTTSQISIELMRAVGIGDRLIRVGAAAFIIAEAGVNHNGDLGTARALIDVAANAGADAVKFQTFHADHVATPEAPKAGYQLQTTSEAESQLEMLRRLELSPAAHRELQAYCQERGVVFLSTPFDEAAADFLEELGVPAFKISSGDLTNSPLLEHVAHKGKPVILSTGMANLEEVSEAVTVLRAAGCDDLILMHCVSNYPASPADVNLRAIRTMQAAFDVPVGFSDHTEGVELALAAVAIGACVIEKHFTLDRNLPGPDHRASLEPAELQLMIRGIRKVESALGDGRKTAAASELDTARVARRSLVAARDVSAGAVLERNMIVLKRPGTGLSPSLLGTVIGRRARRNIAGGSLLELEMFD